VHDDPPAQTTPQSPQLLSSLVTSMHWPLQDAEPVAHRHEPLEHISPPGHTLPHEPQLFGSPFVSTHRSTQNVRCDAQPETQLPSEQTWPLSQALLHAPQWATSV
jgi:hypothetical protein